MSLGGILLSSRVYGQENNNKIIYDGVPLKSDHQLQCLSSVRYIHGSCPLLRHREFGKSMQVLKELREVIECVYQEHRQKRKF